jgi:hypothetical protein
MNDQRTANKMEEQLHSRMIQLEMVTRCCTWVELS